MGKGYVHCGRFPQLKWWMYITRFYVVQGEERDSSDEEWASAYATMDPLSQLGWRNRRAGVEGPAEQLMRDVFEAVDAVHSDAMLEMGGSSDTIDNEGAANVDNAAVHSMSSSRNDDEGAVHVDAAVMESMSSPRAGYRSPTASVEVDQEGAAFSSCLLSSACILCTHTSNGCARLRCKRGRSVGSIGRARHGV